MRTLPIGAMIKVGVFAMVTIALTWVLGMTIASGASGSTSQYSAVFTDASHLQAGDDVRISGVKIGQVASVTLLHQHYAKVSFDLDNQRKIPVASTAQIKYRDLVGRRYVSLNVTTGDPNRLLPQGGVIPVQHTQPALNLTVLFNGFQPLFQALNPKDVNQLATEIIEVFQGEGQTIDGLLQDTAGFTKTIASRDKVIGQLITNLNKVLDTINQHSPQLSNVISDLQQLVSGLSAQRKPIGDAISALDGLTSTTAGLLRDARPDLHQDITQLGNLSKQLADKKDMLNGAISSAPGRLRAFTRTVSYGSWFNFFTCNVQARVGVGNAKLDVPMLPIGQESSRCQ